MLIDFWSVRLLESLSLYVHSVNSCSSGRRRQVPCGHVNNLFRKMIAIYKMSSNVTSFCSRMQNKHDLFNTLLYFILYYKTKRELKGPLFFCFFFSTCFFLVLSSDWSQNENPYSLCIRIWVMDLWCLGLDQIRSNHVTIQFL